jgi:HEAT repeat protein
MATCLVWIAVNDGTQAQTKVDASKASMSPTGKSVYQSPEDSIKEIQEAERSVEKLRKGPKTGKDFRAIGESLMRKAALPVIIRVVKEKHSPWWIRQMMLEALTAKEVEDQKNWEVMIEIVRDQSDDPVVREKAALELGYMKIEGSVDVLIEALRDSSAHVRCGAAGGLQSLGKKKALPALIEALSKEDKQSYAFLSLENAVADFRDPAVRDLMLEFLNDPHPFICGVAIRGLGNQRDSSLIQYIKPFLNHNDDLLRYDAMVAIGTIDGEQAFRILSDIALDSKSGFDVMEAVKILGKLGDVRGIEILKKVKTRPGLLLDNNDQKVIDRIIKNIEKSAKEK